MHICCILNVYLLTDLTQFIIICYDLFVGYFDALLVLPSRETPRFSEALNYPRKAASKTARTQSISSNTTLSFRRIRTLTKILQDKSYGDTYLSLFKCAVIFTHTHIHTNTAPTTHLVKL